MPNRDYLIIQNSTLYPWSKSFKNNSITKIYQHLPSFHTCIPINLPSFHNCKPIQFHIKIKELFNLTRAIAAAAAKRNIHRTSRGPIHASRALHRQQLYSLPLLRTSKKITQKYQKIHEIEFWEKENFGEFKAKGAYRGRGPRRGREAKTVDFERKRDSIEKSLIPQNFIFVFRFFFFFFLSFSRSKEEEERWRRKV